MNPYRIFVYTMLLACIGFTAPAQDLNPWRWQRTDFVLIGGLGASGAGIRVGLVYFDATIGYKTPDFAYIRPWYAEPGDPDYSESRSTMGFALGGIIPVWRFGLMGGVDLHVRKKSYSLYDIEIKSSAKYSYQLHYMAGLYYLFDEIGIGLGYGTGRSFNATFMWQMNK